MSEIMRRKNLSMHYISCHTYGSIYNILHISSPVFYCFLSILRLLLFGVVRVSTSDTVASHSASSSVKTDSPFTVSVQVKDIFVELVIFPATILSSDLTFTPS
jgi:hypothetical protein